MHCKYLRKWSKPPQPLSGEVYSNRHALRGCITRPGNKWIKGLPRGRAIRDWGDGQLQSRRHWSCCWLLRFEFVFMFRAKMTPQLFRLSLRFSLSLSLSNKWNVLIFFLPKQWILVRVAKDNPHPLTVLPLAHPSLSIHCRTFVNTPFQQLLPIIILTFVSRSLPVPLPPPPPTLSDSLATSRFLFFLFQFPRLRLRFDLCTFKRFAYCFCA